MGNIRRKSSQRIYLPKEEQDTLVPCPCCKGTGKIIIYDDGRTYRTKRCRWCDTSGGVTRDILRCWNRLQRWIIYYETKKIPFRF